MQGTSCSFRCPHRGDSTKRSKGHSTNCVFCPNGRGCPDHVSQDPMEGKDNPPQSPDRLSRSLRDKGLDTGAESVFQVSEVRAHCQSLHGPTSKMSNLRGDPLVGCMSEEERPKHRSKGGVCQLRGGPPGVKQAMQKTESNSTNPHREKHQNFRGRVSNDQRSRQPPTFQTQSGPRRVRTAIPPSPSRVTLQR